MVVTDSGIEMEVSDAQPENADPLMVVTESGMEMEVRYRQPANACNPIIEKESGMVKLPMRALGTAIMEVSFLSQNAPCLSLL